MLVLWVWMMILLWLTLARAEGRAADLSDTNAYGILLGTLGAITGFLASSLVNYNYGDAEVAMLVWVLRGVALVQEEQVNKRGGHGVPPQQLSA